jgi:hypothetical protein
MSGVNGDDGGDGDQGTGGVFGFVATPAVEVLDAEDRLAERGSPPRFPRGFPWGQRWVDRAARWTLPLLPHLRWAAYAAVVAVVAVTLVLRWPAAPHAAKPAPIKLTGSVALIAELKFVAGTVGPLANHNRGDTSAAQCPSMPIGQSPLDGITIALHRDLPQFTLVDSSQTLDRTTATCEVVVRARDGAGRTAVIIVNAPPNAASADQVETEQDGSTAYVAVATTSAPTADVATCLPRFQCDGSRLPIIPAGWKVEVGVVSPVNDQPSTDTLLTMAYDPGLIW